MAEPAQFGHSEFSNGGSIACILKKLRRASLPAVHAARVFWVQRFSAFSAILTVHFVCCNLRYSVEKLGLGSFVRGKEQVFERQDHQGLPIHSRLKLPEGGFYFSEFALAYRSLFLNRIVGHGLPHLSENARSNDATCCL